MPPVRPLSFPFPPGLDVRVRDYDVHGRRLTVRAADDDLHRATASVLRHRGILPRRPAPRDRLTASSPAPDRGDAPAAGPAWDLQIGRLSTLPSLSPAMEQVGRLDRTAIDVYRSGDRLIVRTDGAQAEVDVANGRGRLGLTPACAVEEARGPTQTFTHLVGIVLVGLTQAAGWVSLHAAVLVRNRRGVMLLAESDAGKSTMAFQLVRQGWQFVSDDSVLLRETDRGIEALSMRPHFCLDAGSERHFPELTGQDWPEMVRDEVKWRVDVEQLYPGRFLPSCQPHAVVMPAISDAAESRLAPVAAHTLLPALLQQSGFVLIAGSKHASRHFELIGRLLQQCATYRFGGGRDVLEDGRRVHRLFEDRITTENPGPRLRRRRTA